MGAPPTGGVTLSFTSLMVPDPAASAAFYTQVFGLPPVSSLDSPYFRGLRIGDTILGLNGPKAYELLRLTPTPPDTPGVDTFLTFEASSTDEVDTLTARAVAAGASVVAEPAETYYGAWQSVLTDPDGHVFRINHLSLDD